MLSFTLVAILLLAGAHALPTSTNPNLAQRHDQDDIKDADLEMYRHPNSTAVPAGPTKCYWDAPQGTGFNKFAMSQFVAEPLCHAIQDDGTVKVGPVLDEHGQTTTVGGVTLEVKPDVQNGYHGFSLESDKYVGFIYEKNSTNYDVMRCINSMENIMTGCGEEKNQGGYIDSLDEGNAHYWITHT